jgi:hypothetical protein
LLFQINVNKTIFLNIKIPKLPGACFSIQYFASLNMHAFEPLFGIFEAHSFSKAGLKCSVAPVALPIKTTHTKARANAPKIDREECIVVSQLRIRTKLT